MPLKQENNVLAGLCRICFEYGSFFLDTYNVSANGTEEEITAEEMLKKFTIFTLNNKHYPVMICDKCLQELISSFYFYNKVQESDQRLIAILENVDIDSETKDCVTNLEFEQVHKKLDNHMLEGINLEVLDKVETDMIEEHTDLEVLEVLDEMLDFDNQTEYYTEDIESYEDTTKMIDELSDDQSVAENNEFNKNEEYITTEKEPTFSIDAHYFLHDDSVPPLKSNYRYASTKNITKKLMANEQRNVQTRSPKKCQKNRNKSDQLIEKGSFVVAQFVPSNTTIQIETVAPDCFEELVTVNELRTMDYAAVEIKGSKQIEINEADCSTSEKNDRRVYLCQYCPRAFSSSQFLITHVRKSHACKYCTKAFEKNSDLFKHIRLEHSSHKCVICSKDFSTNSNLRHHLKKVHGVKLPVHISLLSFNKDGNDNIVEEFDHEERLEDTEGVLFV